MKNQKFLKLLKRKQNNSGFTLLELLTGLVMSGIVIGVLGVGFYQVLKVTSEDASKTQAREQATRAIEFITDELRRSKGIEINTSIGYIKNRPNNPATPHVDESTIPIAPSYNLPTDGTIRLALEIPGVSERVIYSVAPPQNNSPWEGPLVIYRWGPPFDADGNYTNENDVDAWSNLALVDKVDDTTQSITCEGKTISYQGFYACIGSDDDGDGITENGLTDTNGDGTVDAQDSIDDVDGIGTTAQLYFTGGISTTTGNDTNYTTDTKVVARAKVADVAASVDKPTASLTFESLGAKFNCNSETNTGWGMRTDVGQFEDSATGADRNPSNLRKWVYNPERKDQPIKIDPNKPLYITAIPLETDDPIDANSCQNPKFNNKENHSILGKDDWHDTNGDGTNDKDIVYTQIKIDFNNQYTFNGDATDGSYNEADVRMTDTDGDGDIDSDDVPDPKVAVLKQGTTIPGEGDGGYGGQQSLGEFLAEKGYAYFDATDKKYKMYKEGDTIPLGKKLLGNDQRIIAFEIGQDEKGNSGFDLQDNIFVVTSEAFAENKF